MKKGIMTAIGLMLMISSIHGVSFAQEKNEKAAEKEKKEKNWSISIGAIGHFSWWKPVWQKTPFTASISGFTPSYTFKIKPAFLYGPVFGVSFNPAWGLSGSFIYSRYKAVTRSYTLFPPTIIPISLTRTAIKMDADLLINHVANQYVKLFFGPKYQGYSYTDKASGSNRVAYHSVSLGFGTAFTVPIVSTLFFQPGISAFGLMGWEKRKAGSSKLGSSDKQSNKASIKTATALGVNGSLAFGYYIQPAHLTFSAGYRVQYIYYFKKSNTQYVNKSDLFHGAFVSVIATF
jgi:hypothetical protein